MMPELKPITAVRFAVKGLEAVVSGGASGGGADVSSKIAPPYDVLDAEPKAAMLARDGHNIVAVDLPVTPPKTVGPDEAYAAAGALYRQWLADGVLKRADAAGGESRLGVVMRSTPLQSVMDVSLADEVMPAKSTYFYPKLATGLVVNPLD